MDIEEIFKLIKNLSPSDRDLITRAFAFAQKAHKGQKRYSGEDYIVHPFNVALLLAEFETDAETIAAGLLHDTIENSDISAKELEKEFGPAVAFLVEGVTKLGKLKYQGAKRHSESLRKLFVAMAEDIRVIMIRLADRLHNVRTLQYVPKEKQKRIALETIELYAPLANRLGVWKMKGRLEDASFPFAYPEDYQKVVDLRKTKGKETVKRLQKVYRVLQKAITEKGLKDFEIDYRLKYLYSLYTKLLRKNMDINDVYDISALRVVVRTTEECYQVLGIVHSLWRPITGRLKDYIANPKPNGYQSIHTAVFIGDGTIVEIQIRTKQMQHEAEYGIASHVVYDEKSKKNKTAKASKNIQWIQDLINWQKEIKDGEKEKFVEELRRNFFHDRIFVFTPKGEVVELPESATPIDFAYAIHSDIGNHASGAKINDKMSHLDAPLANGDLVEILTNKNSGPRAKWLNFVKTTDAKRHIRAYLHLKRQKGEVAFNSLS
ncbi:MAG TPA: RelA/SpoT family protein [Candidatus Paceibacterota bacterium]|nr:RelA/SpoT family protein [Candidatus Paceibacterota bacterium]